jgi:hypothetical protein
MIEKGLVFHYVFLVVHEDPPSSAANKIILPCIQETYMD